MHTVRQLAELAGVTPRTLHHYDAIGLLKPTLIGGNGYRYYAGEALLRLQQILIYRELGMDLATIKRAMTQKNFSVVEALEAHRGALWKRIQRLQKVVNTVERTIAAQKGEERMNDQQLFEGLNAQERVLAEEAMRRWDPAVVKESHRRYGRLSADQKLAMKAEGEKLLRDWSALIGTDPTSQAVRNVVERWKTGIEFHYATTPEILRGLAKMYNDDPRFKSNYDKVDPRLAAFVAECVKAIYPEA